MFNTLIVTLSSVWSNPVTLLASGLVLILLLGLFFVLRDKNRKAKLSKALYDQNSQVKTTTVYPPLYEAATNDKPVELTEQQTPPTQQGEEEFKLVHPDSQEDKSPDVVDQVSTINQQSVEGQKEPQSVTSNETGNTSVVSTRYTGEPLTVEKILELSKVDVPKVETLEDKLAKPYVFYSRELLNANRYTVVGQYQKVEVSEEYPTGYKLVLAYAVIGAPDKKGKTDKFSRVKGRELATKKLEANAEDAYSFSVTQEELNYPGRTFAILAKTQVPLTVFDSDTRSYVHRYYATLDGYNPAPGSQPTEEDTKNLQEYCDSIKKADYKHLVATVEPQVNQFGQTYLEIDGIHPFIDDEPSQTDVVEATI